MKLNFSAFCRKPEVLQLENSIVFCLHDNGGNAQDFDWLVEALPETFGFVSFQKSVIQGGQSDWFKFKSTGNMESSEITSGEAIATVDDLVQDMLAVVNEWHAPAAPIYLVGQGTGGTLAYAIAFKYPQFFQKVVCMNGFAEKKIINTKADKKAISKLRFFISHGANNRTIPLTWARAAADFLYSVGCYFTFREYVSGEEINLKNRLDLVAFLQDLPYPVVSDEVKVD